MTPDELRYSKEHEWAKLDDDTVIIGITDYAQSELGDIVFIELPSSGTSVVAGDAIATVEAVKAVSDIYSPVSGQIIEVNDALRTAPDNVCLLYTSPSPRDLSTSRMPSSA
mgnify:CR=1 FL=1